MVVEDYREGQIWERLDGDHKGHRLLVTRVNGRSVKARTVGVAARAPNRGNEKHKITIPLDELRRHYALFRDTKQQERVMTIINPGAAPVDELPVPEMRWEEQDDAPEVSNGEADITRRGTKRKRAPISHYSARLSPEQVTEVLRLYEDWSISTEEIQRTYDITGGLLYRLLQQHDVPTRKSRGYKGLVGRKPAVAASAVETMGTAVDRERERIARLESNVSALVLPMRQAAPEVQQRAWYVEYIVTRRQLVAAPSVDEALRMMREAHGEDIDIVSVQRT